MRDIYLDNNATTALDERVLDAMLPVLRHVGNPSSAHLAGQAARSWVEDARRQVAALLDASPREIVFTSGSTEANNLALQGPCSRCGLWATPRRQRDHGASSDSGDAPGACGRRCRCGLGPGGSLGHR